MRKPIIAIAIIAALAMALCLGGCGGSSSSASSGGSSAPKQQTVDPAKAKYDEAVALYDAGKYYSAKVAFEESQYEDWEERAAACVQTMPETGEYWHSSSMESDEMELVFTVNDNPSDLGLFIAVYTEDKELAEIVFFRGADSVETWLPGGNYYIKDASGYEWYGDIELFGADGYYETMVFEEFDGDPYLSAFDAGYAWEITINTSSTDGQGVSAEENDWQSW